GGDQAVGAGDVDTGVECRVDRRQQRVEKEGDDDRQHREDRARLAPPQSCPYQWKVLHDSAVASTRRPLSRWSVCVANSAALGSCVTMMMVLPCSRLRICGRP